MKRLKWKWPFNIGKSNQYKQLIGMYYIFNYNTN